MADDPETRKNKALAEMQSLGEEIWDLVSRMFKNPKVAYHNLVKSSRADSGIDGTIDKLTSDPHSLGVVVGGRIGKKNVQARLDFKKDRENLISLLKKVDQTKHRLAHIESGLKEVERYENQQQIEEPPAPQKKLEQNSRKKPEPKKGADLTVEEVATSNLSWEEKKKLYAEIAERRKAEKQKEKSKKREQDHELDPWD